MHCSRPDYYSIVSLRGEQGRHRQVLPAFQIVVGLFPKCRISSFAKSGPHKKSAHELFLCCLDFSKFFFLLLLSFANSVCDVIRKFDILAFVKVQWQQY